MSSRRSARSERRRLRRRADARRRDCGGRCARARRDPREQRLDELLVSPTSVNDRAAMVGVDVHVEQARRLRERAAQRLDHRLVASFRELRHGLQHAPDCRAMEAYDQARAPEYDDWWLGPARFEARDRPGWDEERDRLLATIAALRRPECSTSPPAPASRHGTCRARSRGSTRAPPCSRSRACAFRMPDSSSRMRCACRSSPALRARLHASLLRAPRGERDACRSLTEARRVAPELVVDDRVARRCRAV